MKTITIFGGTGDLSYRKLFPAMYNMYCRGILNDDDVIIAVGRRGYSDTQYIELLNGWVQKFARLSFSQETFANFAKLIRYCEMDFTDKKAYRALDEVFGQYSATEHLFYFAVAPQFFEVITDGITGLTCKGTKKLVVEKPFGETIKQARELGIKQDKTFGSENVYRIDHYLGKEMISSIDTLRFSNMIFSGSWNRDFIEHIQIEASEQVGVETRARYYDNAGALKDMVQNHLFQILTLIAMEPPKEGVTLQQRQLEVLRHLRPVTKETVADTLLLAAYKGYREEPGVNPDSKTETFAFCRLFIDTERFRDVPFYITTGKRLSTREMNVIVTFKATCADCARNVLVFKIQPSEGITLRFNTKKPGEEKGLITAEMDFCQSCFVGYRINTPEAYERLLTAVIMSDRSRFSDWETIHASWEYIESLKRLYHETLPIYEYEQGSRGPNEVTRLIQEHGHSFDYTQFYCRVGE